MGGMGAMPALPVAAAAAGAVEPASHVIRVRDVADVQWSAAARRGVSDFGGWATPWAASWWPARARTRCG